MAKITLCIPVEEVVPHQRPMSLLRHVIAHDADTTVCDVRIDRETTFIEGDGVPSWIGLEYMAQAVAAHAGMKSRRRGKPPEIGFLLGTRKADFFTQRYHLSQVLKVTARAVWGEKELFSFDCSIADAADGRSLARAQLNVFRPEHPNRFFKKDMG